MIQTLKCNSVCAAVGEGRERERERGEKEGEQGDGSEGTFRKHAAHHNS